MSFPRYPEYKDSGVEWLGEVPGHWEVTALKRGFDVTLGKMLQPESTGPEDELLPYLRAANIQWSGIDCTDIKQMWLSKRDRAQLRLERGDLLVSEGGDVGRSCIWADELEYCYFQNSVNRVRARDGHSNRYLYYWMSTVKDKGYIDVLCNKSTIAHFTAEKVAAVPVPLPTPTEQTQIATFLDRETAKIDALVAAQRRLMALLKEKRQAVISHAVTRGLNPHAPLKPSGIEWLGDVPQHWEVRKLSQLFRAGKGKNGQMLTKEYCAANDGEYPVYSGQTENEGVMGTWDQFEFDFGADGVLFSTTVGAKAMNLRQLFGRFSLSQNCMIIWTTSNSCLNRYYYYHFQPLFQWQRSMIPDHMQPSFRMEDLYSFAIAVPPWKEQSAIVAFLDAESAKFDTLTTEAQRAIDLLQERRTALISAAVTGQIDVRGVVFLL